MGKPSSSSSPASPAAIATTRRTSSSIPAVAKSASQDDMKRKKKKGRPSLLDLQKRQQQQQQKINTNNNKTLVPSQKVQVSAAPRRSSRRNPLNSDLLNRRDGYTYDDDDDDDDERQQKKVKLVVRLPQSSSDQGQQFRDSPSRNSQDSSSPGSDSDTDDAREREINAVDHRSTDAGPDQGEKAVKATDTVHGSSLESGPTTPLPDKTMLVFVLDRLQKKDTYGVFSEPVDPNELPDYHEIIEHPMDFGTVRKKLDGGAYNNLEELEADVVLICSNAIQYNSSDTVYFRQARSIQELAKRDFDNLRNEGDNGEPQPKVVRRGRPPSKNLKKPSETSPVDHVGLEVSSGATPASGEDKASGSNGYNLRKGPMFYKFRSNDASGTSLRTRNGENYSDWLVDWNSEFPASILRADMKYGKKHFSVDENRRDTYKQFDPSPSSSTQSYFLNAFGDVKRLMAVGLHMDSHAYARSLARYAANLGPVAWNVACRKLNSALPDGIPFGPGWVEENDVPLPFSPDKFKLMKGFVCDHDSNSRPVDPSTPTPDLSCAVQWQSGEDADTAKRLSCQNESTNVGGGLSWTTPGTPFQTPQKSIFHPGRNGWNGMFGFDLSAQMGGMARVANPAGQSGLEDGSVASQMVGRQSSGEVSALHPRPPPHQASSEQYGNFLSQATDTTDTQIVSEAGISGSRSLPQVSSTQLRQPIAIPPDLNIRVQQQASGSPSSSLQIGSPQPDLALQL